MVKSIHKAVTKYHNKLVILHCISAYPLRADDINLKVLKKYQEFFPDVQIGYSGHEMGLDTCIAAVALGARVSVPPSAPFLESSVYFFVLRS